ncbi:hypothetical protein AB0N05_21170 [Nocardia sp. NPDC051030]|uniref:hypothetical protein n=1 Tax=Nocardia sp. NPDC051030 TaxID=3155162 RepID=UPI003443A51C
MGLAGAMIYRNNGDRTFSFIEHHTIGLGSQAGEAASLHNDRRPDLITMGALSESVAVLANRTPR